jgi:hypothetical protein
MVAASKLVNEASEPSEIPREAGCLCGHRESSHVLWKPQPCINCACSCFRLVKPGDKRLRTSSDARRVT